MLCDLELTSPCKLAHEVHVRRSTRDAIRRVECSVSWPGSWSELQWLQSFELEGLSIPAKDSHEICAEVRHNNVLASRVRDCFVLVWSGLSVWMRAWLVEREEVSAILGEVAALCQQPRTDSRAAVVCQSKGTLTGWLAVDDAADWAVGGCGVLDMLEAAVGVDGEAAERAVW